MPLLEHSLTSAIEFRIRMEENAATMSAAFTLTEEDMTALTDMDQVRKQFSSM